MYWIWWVVIFLQIWPACTSCSTGCSSGWRRCATVSASTCENRGAPSQWRTWRRAKVPFPIFRYSHVVEFSKRKKYYYSLHTESFRTFSVMKYSKTFLTVNACTSRCLAVHNFRTFCLHLYWKVGNVLFKDTLSTFYLRLYGVGHMVNNHSDNERGSLLPPYGLLFPISSNGSFIYTIPQTW